MDPKTDPKPDPNLSLVPYQKPDQKPNQVSDHNLPYLIMEPEVPIYDTRGYLTVYVRTSQDGLFKFYRTPTWRDRYRAFTYLP
jgi:hypothetical protein